MNRKKLYEKLKKTNNTAYKRLLEIYKYHLKHEVTDLKLKNGNKK